MSTISLVSLNTISAPIAASLAVAGGVNSASAAAIASLANTATAIAVALLATNTTASNAP
jgi:hypothetical protein